MTTLLDLMETDLGLPATDLPDASTIPVETPDVFSRAICLTLTLEAFGTSRKIDKQIIQTEADKARLRASQKILDAPEVKAIGAAMGELRRYVASMSVPSPLKAGTYMVPLRSVLDVERRLRELQTAVETAVDIAARALPMLIEKDRRALADVFREEHYPTPERFRHSYSVRWAFFAFGGPSVLRQISADLYERSAQDFAETVRVAASEVRDLLRAQMADLVDHMVERITPSAPGEKPKVFRDSLVTNLREFLAGFDARNLTSDTALQGLVTQAQQLLDGVEPETLRKAADVRTHVAQGFTQIRAALDGMLQDRPDRAITLPDD